MTTNTIRIKRRSTGNAGAPSSLKQSELAFNEVDNTLYYGKGADSNGDATSIVTIGGLGAFIDKTSDQTGISGDKTFTGTVTLGSGAVATTPSTSDDSTKVATTAYVKAQNFGSGTVTSVGLSLPGIFSVSNSPVTSSGTLTGALATQSANAVFVGPTTGSDAAPSFRALVAGDIPTLTASKVSDFDTQVRTSSVADLAAPSSALDMNSQKITGLADPTASSDAVSKGYVDAVRSGLDVKDSVRAASVSSLTLSGTQTVDGIALNAGDRILVKDQSTSSENGIYVVASGSWSRATDFDADTEVTSGAFFFVEEGSTQADAGFTLTTDGSITVGTTALSFTQFSGAGQVTANGPLSKSGNALSLDLKSNGGLVTESDELAVDLGASSITGTLAVSDGGTGSTSASAARTALGLQISSDILAYDAGLASIAALTTSANKGIYATASDTYATFDLTSAGRALLDDADASAQRTTLGLAINSDVQAHSDILDDIAGVTQAANKLVYFDAATTAATADLTAAGRALLDDADASAQRSTLGLGSISTQNSNNVSITGGSISGVTFDGGTF